MTMKVLAAILALALAANSAVAADRPNIIFVIADDLNTDLGVYGHRLVKTPNLERLAKRGVRFDHAYCQSPICNPSRTSLLSSRRPGDKLKQAVFLPDFLRANGYTAIEIGKFTHSYGITASAIQWDAQERGGAPAAAALLADKRKQPLFLAIGMGQTHPGYSYNAKYLDLYPPEKITLLQHPPELLTSFPKNAFAGISVNASMTPDERRKHISRYYAAISTVDEQLGLILDALDRNGLWESTIVIFTSDHGRHLGEFGGVYDKRTLFEASVRVPLIVAAPAGKMGQNCARLVELLDLYPTLADLCGLRTPEGLAGKSLAPLLQDPQQPWSPAVFSSVSVRGGAARSVRTERYRFIEWSGQKQAALFDYEEDPLEQRNLFGAAEQAKIVDELRRLLQERK